MSIHSKQKQVNACIIVNPVSGTGDPKERRKRIQLLAKQHGWMGMYRETTKTRNAGVIAQEEIAKGIDHIIVCGGDGSVMEVLSAVYKKNVVLGIVPLGTANLLARNISIPMKTEDAVKVAFVGNHKKIDIGKANGTYFSVIAGIGLDAEVMQATKREKKDKWGFLAYVFSALYSLQNTSARYRIELDGKIQFTLRAKTIMAANMGKLISGIELVPSTDPQSGSLQLGIVKARSIKAWLSIIVHAIVGRIDNSPHYDVYTAKSVAIHSLSGKKTI